MKCDANSVFKIKGIKVKSKSKSRANNEPLHKIGVGSGAMEE